ncbi:MAG: hypothetical protein JST82_13575 [Bacteroidetes bacterium]|nr:hypothetical protein [Bacteroidota bacterium]
MGRFITVVLAVLLPNIVLAQHKCYCDYAGDSIPKKVFTFANGKHIYVCGKQKNEYYKGQAIFSEICVNKDVEPGAIIETKEDCVICLFHDTLYVKFFDYFAIGAGLHLIKVPYLSYKYYYDNQNGDNLLQTQNFNTDIHYTPLQIAIVLNKYNQTEWVTQTETGNDERIEYMMRLANQLMVAAISGNKIAEECFYHFKEKFKPQGIWADWYEEMKTTISYAKSFQDN